MIKNYIETNKINVNENRGELLRQACKGTYIEIVKYIMSPKPDINKIADPKYCRDLVLPWACIGTIEDVYGNTKEVDIQITHSKDEDVLKLVQYLVEIHNIDVSLRNNFALRQACIYNYIQFL